MDWHSGVWITWRFNCFTNHPNFGLIFSTIDTMPTKRRPLRSTPDIHWWKSCSKEWRQTKKTKLLKILPVCSLKLLLWDQGTLSKWVQLDECCSLAIFSGFVACTYAWIYNNWYITFMPVWPTVKWSKCLGSTFSHLFTFKRTPKTSRDVSSACSVLAWE